MVFKHFVSFCSIEDVFILDTGEDCFVWIGGGATLTEKRNGLPYAHVR